MLGKQDLTSNLSSDSLVACGFSVHKRLFLSVKESLCSLKTNRSKFKLEKYKQNMSIKAAMNGIGFACVRPMAVPAWYHLV